MIVWDRGTYKLLEGTDVCEQIAKGSLKFELCGKKLHGAFALVHIKGRGGEENAWLLIKERDDFVDPSWKIDDHPESVKSGKTNDEIKKDPKAEAMASGAGGASQSRAAADRPLATRSEDRAPDAGYA